ncbi:host specificity protein J [Agarilytica rhodophyticola]|uniref:host specificity protein J n=1 Tax=Agarilytica rhodophyticola TaxID=1737490 RepID=UPI000B344033|nr:phage tail protein [Agarilytica rhodophyticola]
MDIIGNKGGKAGGGAARAAQEDPNTLKSVATARVLDLVSEGEIEGLVNGLQSVYLDGVPVQNDDGSFNFEGVAIDTRVGLPVQDYIEGFGQVESEFVVDQEVLFNTPVVRAITNDEVDAVRVKIVVPALTSQDPENGDLHGYNVVVRIDVQYDGGAWNSYVSSTIAGKTTSEYERSFNIVRTRASSSWNIRVVRISRDSDDDATKENKTFWGTYTELIDTKLSYPDCAIIAVAINAEQFGDKVPRREYHIRGRKVPVPSNYNPQTRQYTGIWNGTFVNAWTNNPAWCYYDMVTHDRYGLGEFIEPFRVDKGRLYQISQYCDELVDDGFGGQEPRFTLNVQIRTREEAQTLIRKLASVFRGVTYWGSGTVIPVQDAPADYEFLACPANVIDGKFTYSSKSLKNRSTAALVTYNDPNDGEKAAVEVYEDSDAVAVHGWKQKDITAFGCNSRGLARRVGKWEIEHDQNATTTVTYRAALDHLSIRPYSVIAIQDPAIAGERLSGRMVSVRGSVLTVDALPDSLISSTYTYRISYITPEGRVSRAEVFFFDVANNQVHLYGPVADVQPNSIWVLSANQLSQRLFRVTSVSAQSDNIYSVEAEIYDPNKFARVEQDLVFDDGDYTDLPTGPLPAPTNLVLGEYLVRQGNVINTVLTASVTAPNDSRASFVQFQYKPTPSDAWLPASIESQPFFEVRDVRDGNVVQVRARSVGRLGLQSAWVTSSQYQVVGKLAPPTTPTNFTAVIRPDTGIFLSKDPSPDVDYKETRFFEGVTFESAVELGRVAGNTLLLDSVQFGRRTYWAVDYDTGDRSSDPVSTEITIYVPTMYDVSHSYAGADVVLEWGPAASSFVIAEYQVWHGDILLARTRATNQRIRVDWIGSRSFDVVAVDIVGNGSIRVSELVSPRQPGSANVTASVIDNSVQLTYSAQAGDLPIKKYEIFIGDRFNEAEKFQDKAGDSTFTIIQERRAGSYTYHFIAVDTAGNRANPSSATAIVSQLPDYVFFDSFSERELGFDGVSTNCFVDNGALVALVDPDETMQEYIDNGFDTFQEEINAGFELFATPGQTSARYEKIYDLGATLATSLITSNVSVQTISGNASYTLEIAYSNDGVNFIADNNVQVFGIGFRYVRIVVDVASDGGANDILVIDDIFTSLDLKEQGESGRDVASASDANGTRVALRKNFIDVTSISVTPNATVPRYASYSFDDVVNPTEFFVRLFDNNGNRVSGVFSYSVRGYLSVN